MISAFCLGGATWLMFGCVWSLECGVEEKEDEEEEEEYIEQGLLAAPRSTRS